MYLNELTETIEILCAHNVQTRLQAKIQDAHKQAPTHTLMHIHGTAIVVNKLTCPQAGLTIN